MIDESGAVIPDIVEINQSIDTQFTKKAQKNEWQKCGQCDFYGTLNQMQFHKLGQHSLPS